MEEKALPSLLQIEGFSLIHAVVVTVCLVTTASCRSTGLFWGLLRHQHSPHSINANAVFDKDAVPDWPGECALCNLFLGLGWYK